MSSYVDSVLSPGETVQYRAKCSVWSLLPLIILGLLLITVVIGVVFWLAAFLRYISVEMAVTNKRVIAKTGFITRRTVELNLAKVESIQVEQGLLGRLFNYGTIVVAGAGTPQAPVAGITDPLKFRAAVLQTQEASIAEARKPVAA